MPVAAHRFHIGQFECLVVQDHEELFPITRLLPNVPQDEIEQILRQHGYDPQALPFSMNILLVNTGRRLILVDTGIGKNSLPEKLQSQGIDPAAIDTVVVSHGHGDHVGGILDAAGSFPYPNARYVIWQSEFDYWTAPEQLATADKNPAIAVWKTFQAHQDKVDLIGQDGEEVEIGPGVCAIAAPGHTPGHIALTVESGGQRLLHIVDAAHSLAQVVHTGWSPNFDYDKVVSATTRRKLFERAARDDALVLTYHFPFPGLGHVTDDDGVLHWTPLSERSQG
jgi:glyoxylase-like metal-dependent hydrolase (beta-lactamase superfamily II)